MTLFEEKVNEYRENKRLLEELEAMNESIKADIICMMQGAPEMAQGTAKAIYKDVQSVRLDSKLLKTLHPDVYAECSSRTTSSAFAWYKGVRQVIFSCILFFFWFFSALFKASK